jgi:NADPH:quinone reductase-like Zn-dependent oxidoreductase
VLLEDMTSQIPDDLSFEQAAVLPLGLSTAVSGLFLKDQLGLQLPAADKGEERGKTVLIWGGSTSVGSNAIQLAVATGYEVITVCIIHLPLFSNPKLNLNLDLFAEEF